MEEKDSDMKDPDFPNYIKDSKIEKDKNEENNE